MKNETTIKSTTFNITIISSLCIMDYVLVMCF